MTLDRLHVPPPGLAIAEALALDEAILDATIEDGRSRIALWSSSPSLVVSRRDTRLPAYEAAVKTLAAQGLPVEVRSSGGTCVLQGPGLLTLSVAYSLSPPNFDAAYEILRALAAESLAPLGVTVGLAAVPGAFCDGAHNLVIGGRKMAGTAQRHRKRHYPGTLAHAVLLVDVDLAAMNAAINTFYELAGSNDRFQADRCITLREALPNHNPASLYADIVDALAGTAGRWLEEN